ncbi:DNA-binding response regulator, OmpR family, contains REC and winged-helix (wHTH) domain [Lachnospiraceae bacterium]|nr:DNA-binding response regulator, OmpR family, contains REC and winged-helix (wHTH) domain [Lachnospiraceae bacterium]
MSDKTYKILIAEDESDIIELLRLYLENAGFVVIGVPDGLEALKVIESEHVDLAIFDIMMPKMDGYQLIRKVRETHNLPIMVLSAKNQDSDKILGLDLGADDYLTKPFNPLEIVARVKSALRRFYQLNDAVQEQQNSILRVGDITLNVMAMSAEKNGEELQLTPTEFKILSFLMQHPGRVFTRTQIYENVMGEYYESDDNTIMVHISKIREKIEDDSRKPEYLLTVRGLGYKIAKI